VRDDAKRDLEESRENRKLRDPYLVVRLADDATTFEYVRSKLDGILREEGYVFRGRRGDDWATAILSSVLQDDLTISLEVAYRYNVAAGRGASTVPKETIERETRGRGPVGPDAFLEKLETTGPDQEPKLYGLDCPCPSVRRGDAAMSLWRQRDFNVRCNIPALSPSAGVQRRKAWPGTAQRGPSGPRDPGLERGLRARLRRALRRWSSRAD
jgi:hypothetical protein